MNRYSPYFATLLLIAAIGCDDDPEMMAMSADGGTTMGDAGSMSATTSIDAGMIDGGPPPTVHFIVRIENTSQQSALPSSLSSGVWATHGE